ncbi:hypothetical protein INE85_02759 [Phocaeicola vulgatus]|nr:hypothetical protein INE85_02759 [Phocaeicola vulgatus]
MLSTNSGTFALIYSFLFLLVESFVFVKKISKIPLGCIERICNGHPIALSRSIMNLSS